MPSYSVHVGGRYLAAGSTCLRVGWKLQVIRVTLGQRGEGFVGARD